MSHHLKEIYLDGSHFGRYTLSEAGDRIGSLSKINIFVGPNNSGKSRFLRLLASRGPFRFIPTADFRPFETAFKSLQEGLFNLLRKYQVDDINSYNHSLKELGEINILLEGKPVLEQFYRIVDEMAKTTSISIVRGNNTDQTNRNYPLNSEVNQLGAQAKEAISEARSRIPREFTFKRVYIPTLRGLRTLGNEDFYRTRTIADYFKDNKDLTIFTGISLFDDLRKLLLGTLAERETVASFQTFLSEAFFEKQPVALIPKYDKTVIDVKIGDEKERSIFELGDGIQSIIILTFPVFQYKNQNLLLFIEEPELFLHPGMQRLLLNVLLRDDFSNAQYFLATHSNHLLDLTLDIEKISVFTFHKLLPTGDEREKDAQVTVENVSNENERTLQLLGIQNSAVFLSNCTIWVEGITDRRYLLHYLQLYQQFLDESAETDASPSLKVFKQDLHYSFVEYAGSNITHWSFLDEIDDTIVVERLCGKLLLIADKDSPVGAKEERQEKLQKSLGDRFVRLDCREIENLISPDILRKVVESYEGDSTGIAAVAFEDYKDAALGRFIEETMLGGNKKRRGTYAEASGTVSNKMDFCERVIEFTLSWDNLATDAQLLTTRIREFIASQNR